MHFNNLIMKNCRSAVITIIAITVAGCSGGGNNNNSNAGFFQSLFVANDQGGDTGTVDQFITNNRFSVGLDAADQSFDAGLSEGIAVDQLGNLFQAGINGGDGALRAACSIQNRPGDLFTAGADRVITTSLTGPKGIVHAPNAGVIIAAENGAPTNAISVFSATAGPGAVALFTVTRLSLGNAGAWDIAYDEASDKLFAAMVNGTIAYFPNFLASNGIGIPVIFQPDNALAASNMHGIAYDAAADRLVVTDVAVPSGGEFNVDGSLYVFDNASSLVGSVSPSRTIRGPNSLLGNPVDLLLSGPHAIVAEKANAGGQLLVFRNVASGASGDVAPSRIVATAAGMPPEALALSDEPQTIANDASDLIGISPTGLFVTSNAANAGTDIFAVDANLSTVGDRFTPVVAGQNIESISLSQDGDAVVSFDTGGGANTGGLSFVNRLNQRVSLTGFDADRDRQVIGGSVVLDSPKGFDVVGSRGLVIVADFGPTPGQVVIFSICAGGNVAPLLTTTLPGSARPWDLDYDPTADRLYVAATNGTVLVYDDYLASNPATPDRTIDPDDQSGFPDSNIHGIVHDAASDRLILSDVGSATSSSDGRIYVLNNASTADGVTALRLEIAGPATSLGNPVDLAFDGSDLYVAEKSNNVILKFNNILGASAASVQDRSPDISLNFTAPESVVITR